MCAFDTAAQHLFVAQSLPGGMAAQLETRDDLSTTSSLFPNV